MTYDEFNTWLEEERKKLNKPKQNDIQTSKGGSNEEKKKLKPKQNDTQTSKGGSNEDLKQYEYTEEEREGWKDAVKLHEDTFPVKLRKWAKKVADEQLHPQTAVAEEAEKETMANTDTKHERNSPQGESGEGTSNQLAEGDLGFDGALGDDDNDDDNWVEDQAPSGDVVNVGDDDGDGNGNCGEEDPFGEIDCDSEFFKNGN